MIAIIKPLAYRARTMRGCFEVLWMGASQAYRYPICLTDTDTLARCKGADLVLGLGGTDEGKNVTALSPKSQNLGGGEADG